MLVEVCRYSALDDLDCDDARALEMLDDEFIDALPVERKAEAYSLRGQARYWLTKQRGLPSTVGRTAYQAALEDLDQARQLRSAAIDHYFRGLALAEIDEPDASLAELRWVRYWDAVYDYPFLPADFDQQVLAVEARVEARAAARATEAIAAVEEESPVAQSGASPTPAGPTPTPTPVIPFEERPQLP